MAHSLVLDMLCYIDIEDEYTVHHIFSKGCLKGALISGAPNNGFLLNALKSLFRPSTVLFDLQKYNLTSAIKFISVQSFYSNLSLFQITKASELFSRNFRCNLTFYESEFFSDSSFCFFFEKQLNLGSET